MDVAVSTPSTGLTNAKRMPPAHDLGQFGSQYTPVSPCVYSKAV